MKKPIEKVMYHLVDKEKKEAFYTKLKELQDKSIKTTSKWGKYYLITKFELVDEVWTYYYDADYGVPYVIERTA